MLGTKHAISVPKRGMVRVAAAAGMSLVLLFVPACGGPEPSTPDPVATTSPAADPRARFVTVDGAFNVRDLGGYLTSQGSTVVADRVFRSSSLNRVSEAGLGQLATLKLGLVVDLRGRTEAGARADRLPPGVAALSAPIPGVLGAGPPVAGGLSTPDEEVVAEFRTYVTDATARAGVASALRALATATGPVLVHCNSGTYRTGWTVAVLLTILGVPRATVDEDFLLSNIGLGGTYAFIEYLDAAFAAAQTQFGSFAAYLEQGLGIGPQLQDDLRLALLA